MTDWTIAVVAVLGVVFLIVGLAIIAAAKAYKVDESIDEDFPGFKGDMMQMGDD